MSLQIKNIEISIKTYSFFNDNKDFIKIINLYIERGWKLVEGTYSVEKRGFFRTSYSQDVSFDNESLFLKGYNYLKYYDNGNIKVVGNFTNNLKDGMWTEYFKNGQIQIVENYKNGKLDGEWIVFYQNGTIQFKENYKNGKLDGKRVWYDEYGKLESEEYWIEGVRES
tara:strand:+ start:218 stop:721 length:504 start_codon:yes stop_codon:yes gene_type:complete